MDRHERHADPGLADSASRLAQQPLGVTLDIKLLIFRQLSWREYFFPLWLLKAISQKMVKEEKLCAIACTQELL
jgi:hypothetical protein